MALAFLLYVLAEIWGLGAFVGRFGYGYLFLEIVLSLFIGASLLRRQMFRLAVNPTSPDHLLYLMAGVLLIVPGIISDVLSITLILPPTQVFWRRWFQTRVQNRMVFGGPGFQFYSFRTQAPPPPTSQEPSSISERDVTPLVIETKGTRL